MENVQKLYASVDAHKQYLERYIQHVRLLFKPWPTKSEREENKANPTNDDAPDGSTDNKQPQLTEEERSSVVLVDKLLQKAQKARNIQKKLEEPTRNRLPESSDCKTETNRVTSDNAQSRKPNPQTLERKEIRSDQNSGKARIRQRNCDEEKRDQTKYVNKPTNSSTKTMRTSSACTNKRAMDNNRKSAHSTAPFKTDSNLSSAKLQTTYRATISKRGGKVGVGIQSAKPSVRPVSKDSAKAKKTAENRPTISQARLEYGETKSREGDEESDSCSRSDRSDGKSGTPDSNNSAVNSHVPSGPTGSLDQQMEDLHIEDKKAESNDSKECKPVFLLKQKGSALKLPTELKKAVYSNRKLQEKVYTQNVTQKVNSPPSSQDFITQLKDSFLEEDVLTALETRQVEQLLKIYSNLYTLLGSLSLDSINDDSSTATVLRCRKLVELILVKYQETEQLVHSINFKSLSGVDKKHLPVKQKVPCPADSCLSVWYKNNTWLPVTDHKAVYSYRKSKQLETHLSHMFDLQWWQLQMSLIDSSASILLPLLQSLEPTSREYSQVLRCGYSLLSSNPGKGPVIVQDTIGDDSVIADDDDHS